MKKFFLFAAALFAAVSMNATEYDLTTLKTENDWTVTGVDKNTDESNDTTKFVYDYNDLTGEGIFTPTLLTSNITCHIKNTSAKKKIMSMNIGSGFEFGGKNGILVLTNVKVGSTITLTVASKGSTAANFVDEAGSYPKGAVAVTAAADLTLPVKDKDAEGADSNGYVWKQISYTATASTVEIKEFAAGYRLQVVDATFVASAIENTAASVKAVKMVENGQVVILKNGVKYNVLGAEIK